MAADLVTGKIRFSYPHIFKPATGFQGQEPKYSTVALIPKSDTATIQKIEAACQELYREHTNDLFKGYRYENIPKPFRDGDGTTAKGMEYGQEAKGCWVLTCNSSNKPFVVDAQRRPVSDETMVYPGCWGRVSIGLGAYKVNGNCGIKAYLNGVQTLNKGVPIGHRTTEAVFDDGFVDDDDDDDLL